MTSGTSLPSLLHEVRERARAAPDAVAIRSAAATTTYAELMTEVGTARSRLAAAGVQAATVVRVCGPVHGSTLAVLLAAWSLRSIVWLVADPSAGEQPGDSVDCEAPLVVEVTPSSTGGLHIADGARLNSADDAAVNDVAQHTGRHDDRPGYLVSSSGSTGRRKYILGSYRGLSRFVCWQRDAFGIGPVDVVAHLTDVTFDVVYRELLTPLVSGGTVLLPPAELPPGAVLSHLAETGVTVVNAVPSVARMWLESADHPVNGLVLRRSFFAGEPLDGAFASTWRDLAEDHEVVNLYGPTETTLAAFSWTVPSDHAGRTCPVGRPIGDVAVSLVEPGGESPVDAGSVGEVVIGTRHGSYGYLGRDAVELADAFRLEDGVVRFRTGDLGRMRDGQLELVGRVGLTMKVNGRWVDRGAVESVLRDLTEVTEAVVLPVRGALGTQLVAFVATAGQLDRHRARRAILANLGWTAIPTRMVTMAELPRLPSGKIAVGTLARSGLPTRAGEPTVGATGASEPEIEHALIRHLAHLLGRPVTATDNLLDVGLDSLGTLEVCGVIEELYAVDCTPGDLFEHPVVSDLVRLVADRAAGAAKDGRGQEVR